MNHDDETPLALTTESLRAGLRAVAASLAASATGEREPITGTGGGSSHRRLPENIRAEFIGLRAALFQRGIFDPLLVRFDTATVAQAPTAEIAEQLTRIADSL